MAQEKPLKLTLQAANPVERNLTWEDPEICESPMAFLAFLVKHVSVDAEQLASLGESIVFQPGEPSLDNNKKIWVKTSAPYGIGYFSGGKWRLSYEYPRHAIMELPDGLDVPTFITQLSDSDAEARGLSKDFKWGIFHP